MELTDIGARALVRAVVTFLQQGKIPASHNPTLEQTIRDIAHTIGCDAVALDDVLRDIIASISKIGVSDAGLLPEKITIEFDPLTTSGSVIPYYQREFWGRHQRDQPTRNLQTYTRKWKSTSNTGEIITIDD